jgi:hypothetical protein
LWRGMDISPWLYLNANPQSMKICFLPDLSNLSPPSSYTISYVNKRTFSLQCQGILCEQSFIIL